MADLSRVLQALGAILQGGGGTLTAIDEQKRQREKDEQNRAYMDSVMQTMSDSRDRQALNDRMSGIQDVPAGGLQPMPTVNPTGLPGMEAQIPDQRIVSGNKFVDPSQPSPNDVRDEAAAVRQIAMQAERTLPVLEGLPDFQKIGPETQESVRMLIRSGLMDAGGAMQFIQGASSQEADQRLQEVFFEQSKRFASKHNLPLPFDSNEPVAGVNYAGIYNSMYQGVLGLTLSQRGGGGSGGGLTADQQLGRESNSAAGEASRLARSGARIDEIVSNLTGKFGSKLMPGELEMIATEAFVSANSFSGDTRSLREMESDIPERRRSFNIGGTPDSPRGSRAAQLTGQP